MIHLPTRRAHRAFKNLLRASLFASGMMAVTAAAPRDAEAREPHSVDAPPPASRYHGPRMRITGIVLASLGAAMMVGGATVVLLEQPWVSREVPAFGSFVIGAPLLVGGSVLLGVGVPLWAIGALPATGSTTRGSRRWSPELRLAGAILAGVGGAMTVGGGIALALSTGGGSPGGTTAGLALLGTGPMFLGMGFPMFAVGSSAPPRTGSASEIPAPSLVPDVSIGAGSATLRWTF